MANPRPCSIEGCDLLTGVPGTARGFCHRHYYRFQKYGDPLGQRTYMPKVCTIEGCDKPAQARGWCPRHLSLWYRHGSTETSIYRHPDLKHCNRCDGVYPRSAEFFYRNRSTRDGLGADCKPCARERRKRYLDENNAAINARRRDAYWEDPEAHRAAARAWAEANPEKVRQTGRATLQMRRAKIYGADAERFTDLEIFERDSWVCQICRKRISRRRSYPDPLSPSLDHIVPLSRGGTHTRANAQASHLRCNLRKHTGGIDQLRLIG